ncbi:hypothetical protein X943_000050 [Babesia divergens]|uniref:Uncharacterized protein n=1 Tax=Babesia divergens TaxID=32595 RepID=A0AAD9LGF3_BABDI|nr:hypothetical protein X943_000050 [Babesia divergens]
MVDVGINIANNLKAKNFLGSLSIRNGLFFIAIQQFLLGISLYSIMHYLHPSMTKLACLLFLVNAISALLGFFGALKRNMIIELVYLVFYAGSLFLIFLTVLDMAELVHLLPKAPQLHDVTNLGAMKSVAFLRAGHMQPHSFIKNRDIPFELTNELANKGDDHELDVNSDALPIQNETGSTASTGADDMAPLYPVDPATQQMQMTPQTRIANISDEKLPSPSVENAQDQSGNTDITNVEKGHHTNVTANSTSNGEVKGEQNEQPITTTDISDKDNLKSDVQIKEVAPRKDVPTALQASKKDAAEEKANESFYDKIPLVPHIGETEGEAEEVSKEELPPETRDLSPEGVSEVVVMYKIQKRPLKMAAAGLITMALLFNIYCYWVAVTFVLNKCTCLDELVSHPEQFTPLID